jgi:hypothetical protein
MCAKPASMRLASDNRRKAKEQGQGFRLHNYSHGMLLAQRSMQQAFRTIQPQQRPRAQPHRQSCCIARQLLLSLSPTVHCQQQLSQLTTGPEP